MTASRRAHNAAGLCGLAPDTRIRVGPSQWRFVSTANGYSPSIVAPQHFGLGAKKAWPAVEANRVVKVTP